MISIRRYDNISYLLRNRFICIGFFLFICLLICTPKADAQLAISMQLDRENYILYEPIYAKVTFRDFTGHGLVFGKNAALKGSLKFHIVAPGGKTVKKLEYDGDALLEGTVLNPGATGSFVVPLIKMYNLNKPGNYTVYATISHPQMDKPYKSSSVSFSILNGRPMWERIVGVPDVLNTDGKDKIKTRTVKILNFYDGNKKYYALMIEDADMIYGVIRIAYDLENEHPQVEIDGLSRIHILVQISSKVYSYFVYDIDCRLETFEHYTIDQRVCPVLVRNPTEGTVMVVGGKKAVEGKDFDVDQNPNPVFIED